MKERILEKADELFCRYGIRSITMDEIATQLAISKKTIYQFFADKEELVSAVFNRYMDGNKEGCIAKKDEAENAVHEVFMGWFLVEEMLARLNPGLLYDLERYHPRIYMVYREYRDEFLYRIIKENLERGVAEEVYRADFDIEIISRFRVGCVMSSLNRDMFPDNNRRSPVDIEKELMLHFLYGIVTTKGRRLIEKYNQQRSSKKVLP